MKLLFTITLILALFIKGNSCECPEYWQLRLLDSLSYEGSDVVLVGRIIKIGSEYKIKVIEILKGFTKDAMIIGLSVGNDAVFNTCSFSPSRRDEYLLYLNRKVINGRTIYYSSMCSGSRSLNFEDFPVSLVSGKRKDVLINETNDWIKELKSKNKIKQ
jgi:hypothetical protein